MRFTKFQFENFRGIHSSTLDLARGPIDAVNVLVGLNESGKTTVLEAIDNFRSNPKLTKKNPNENDRTSSDYQAMMPIRARALFDGHTTITASLTMSEEDIEEIDLYIKSKFGFVDIKYEHNFYIKHRINFKNSKYDNIHNEWNLHFYGRKRRGSTAFKKLKGDDWLKVADFIENMLPKIMYFPASLLDFPDRIYLEHNDVSTKKTSALKDDFYYQVLFDVLKSINPNYDIEKHIISRVKNSNENEKQNLDALVKSIEHHLNSTVLGEWKNTFALNLGAKCFKININVDAQNLIYIEIKLDDGNSLFSLKERSAGFRWFFAFTMLVKYRVHRNDRVLFLFDEPAANLHPRAQTELLNSFQKLSKTHQFIFTTHSHYLVNPLWLESTFVVKNEALIEEGNFLDMSQTNAKISITPYRSFVGSYPDQHFYYKPIMDALAYSPAQLDPSKASVLIEGKTDFYCLEYFKNIYFAGKFSIVLFPGGGSGSLDPLISLLVGWGVDFLILLDSDASGHGEKSRYEEKFESLVKDRVSTINEIILTVGNTRLETLFSDIDKELMRTTFFPTETILTKKLLHKAIQELLAGKRKIAFGEETLGNFNKLLKGLESRYVALSLG